MLSYACACAFGRRYAQKKFGKKFEGGEDSLTKAAVPEPMIAGMLAAEQEGEESGQFADHAVTRRALELLDRANASP